MRKSETNGKAAAKKNQRWGEAYKRTKSVGRESRVCSQVAGSASGFKMTNKRSK
jgi:hypothetical protein